MLQVLNNGNCVEVNGKVYRWDATTKKIMLITETPVELKKCPFEVIQAILEKLSGGMCQITSLQTTPGQWTYSTYPCSPIGSLWPTRREDHV